MTILSDKQDSILTSSIIVLSIPLIGRDNASINHDRPIYRVACAFENE